MSINILDFQLRAVVLTMRYFEERAIRRAHRVLSVLSVRQNGNERTCGPFVLPIHSSI